MNDVEIDSTPVNSHLSLDVVARRLRDIYAELTGDAIAGAADAPTSSRSPKSPLS